MLPVQNIPHLHMTPQIDPICSAVVYSSTNLYTNRKQDLSQMERKAIPIIAKILETMPKKVGLKLNF